MLGFGDLELIIERPIELVTMHEERLYVGATAPNTAIWPIVIALLHTLVVNLIINQLNAVPASTTWW